MSMQALTGQPGGSERDVAPLYGTLKFRRNRC